MLLVTNVVEPYCEVLLIFFFASLLLVFNSYLSVIAWLICSGCGFTPLLTKWHTSVYFSIYYLKYI